MMKLLLYVRSSRQTEIAFTNILQEHSFSGYFCQTFTFSHKSHKRTPLNIVNSVSETPKTVINQLCESEMEFFQKVQFLRLTVQSPNTTETHNMLLPVCESFLKAVIYSIPIKRHNQLKDTFDRKAHKYTKYYSILLFGFFLLLLFYLTKTSPLTMQVRHRVHLILQATKVCLGPRHKSILVAGIGDNEITWCLKYSFVNKVGIRITIIQ